MNRFIPILMIALMPGLLQAQAYRDPAVPINQRVEDLLSRMTPEEKFWQLFMVPGDLSIGKDKLMTGIFGFQVSTEGKTADATQQLLTYAPGAPAGESARVINEIQRFFIEESRLGIPVIPFDEGLHGLVRRGATAFPQAIGLAATFDTELMGRVAEAIALEMRSRGIRQILSPVINIASDVRWGRVEETYGEDPFLAAEMSVAFVSEFEKIGVITTPKHLIANVGDGGRDSYPIHLSERYLREIHLPPFAASFGRGGTRSVMTSYNTYDGQFCSGNDWLLNRWLKEELGFDGFVISDANAVGGANVLHMTAKEYWESGADAINGGLDVIFQTSHDHSGLFIDGFLNGAIPQEVIDRAVARVLKAKFELGLFEDPFVDPAEAERLNGHPDHRGVALEAARKSIVLLKNENDVLPLKAGNQKIAVIGRDASEARLGGYSGPGINKISILDGIRQRCEGTGTEVLYAPGCPREEEAFVPVPASALFHREGSQAKPGLKGLYYNNINFEGNPVISRIDPQIRFQWTLFGPDQEKTGNRFYSARWTGQLLSPGSGTWR
ncbi:MAG: glycoside hydrolase family 3 N-terminal domain-containing protein, partial [Bacteroidales bacterium]